MSMLKNISPNELAVLSNAVAIVFAADNSADENNILGNFLTTVGDIILLIAAQQQNIGSSTSNISNK